ncbi:MAG: NUDIX domain-containing protein, partial [Planctomycetota bacterium]|nr:NUDIX domain-containing protein [Planctomycetota bacterium]
MEGTNRDDSPPDRTACGFVLVRARGPGLSYLLLRNRERGEWGLPKGHAEASESELQTALRETREETGLDAPQILDAFRAELLYDATRHGRSYRKRVVYFAARSAHGEVRLSPEHDEAAWLPLDAALARLAFPALAGVVRDAALFLKDPALFALEPHTEEDARAHLLTLPEATPGLLAHLA